MGIEWHSNIYPPLKKGTIGSDMKDLGDYYLETQKGTGRGIWDTGLVGNSIAKSQLEKQLKKRGRGIQVAELLNKVNPYYANMANMAGAQRTNELGWLPWSNPSIYNKDDRLSVGEYSVGGYNLIPDYNRSQTFDAGRSPDRGTPTYKNIKPTSIWSIL